MAFDRTDNDNDAGVDAHAPTGRSARPGARTLSQRLPTHHPPLQRQAAAMSSTSGAAAEAVGADTSAAMAGERWCDPALRPGVSYLDSILAPPALPIQRASDAATDGAGGPDDRAVHAIAAQGVGGAGGPLPHLDVIQRGFGHHDVRGVVAHTDGAAVESSARIGASAFATGNHVAFAGAPDLHTAAHEAAHVVQQRAGVQLAGGVGQAGDPYERQADAAADAVVRGESAAALLEPAGAGADRRTDAVQRFDGRTHKSLGDAGAVGVSVRLGKLPLTPGDLTMLTGDYFATNDLVDRWQNESKVRGQQVGTDDEIMYALHHAAKTKSYVDPRFDKGGVWYPLLPLFSDTLKETVTRRYYKLAEQNYDHFMDPGKGGPGDAKVKSAPTTYREAHELAIYQAYRAATQQPAGTLDLANVTEAMGQHYLTDAFAAGHVTTKRLSIERTWDQDPRYRNFPQQFIDKVARDMAVHLKAHGRGVAGYGVSVDTYRAEVRKQIEAMYSKKAKPSIGKLLGSVAHDVDNVEGLWFTNDVGWKWYGRGDGHIDDAPKGPSTAPSAVAGATTKDQRAVVTAAVYAGYADVRTAYKLGRIDRQRTDYDTLYARVRAETHAPGVPHATKYAAEQMLPRPADPKLEAQATNHSSLEALWGQHIRTGQPTWGELIVKDLDKGGTVGDELEDAALTMEEPVDPTDEAGGFKWVLGKTLKKVGNGAAIYPRTAFRETILDRLRQTTLLFVLELLDNR